MNRLDSGFRRNDGSGPATSICESINYTSCQLITSCQEFSSCSPDCHLLRLPYRLKTNLHTIIYIYSYAWLLSIYLMNLRPWASSKGFLANIIRSIHPYFGTSRPESKYFKTGKRKRHYAREEGNWASSREAWYIDQQMIEKFGDEHREDQKRVPMFIPHRKVGDLEEKPISYVPVSNSMRVRKRVICH